MEIAHLLPALAAMLMLFSVFDPGKRAARGCFSRAALRFTGIISYEWFLFHGPIVNWFHQNTGPTHGSVLAYAVADASYRWLVTFGFSALVYRYFSLPILHRVRGRI